MNLKRIRKLIHEFNNRPRLNPCPRCGGSVRLDRRFSRSMYFSYASFKCNRCNEIFCESFKKSKVSRKEAIDAWNKRLEEVHNEN